MPNPANLAGTMPPEALNGWFGQVENLLAHPDRLRIGVIIFDVDKVTHKVATGADTPIIQIRHVEVVPDADTALREEVSATLRNLQRQRIGDDQLELTYTPGAVAPPTSVAGSDEED